MVLEFALLHNSQQEIIEHAARTLYMTLEAGNGEIGVPGDGETWTAGADISNNEETGVSDNGESGVSGKGGSNAWSTDTYLSVEASTEIGERSHLVNRILGSPNFVHSASQKSRNPSQFVSSPSTRIVLSRVKSQYSPLSKNRANPGLLRIKPVSRLKRKQLSDPQRVSCSIVVGRNVQGCS
jgi:hypothetical protein